MRIQHRPSTQQLILHSRSLAPWIWGLLLIVGGIALWTLRGGLECERSADRCTLGARNLPVLDAREFALSQLQRAELLLREGDGSNTMSRVELEVAGERLGLGIGWSAFNDTNRDAAERINAFLATPAEDRLRVNPAAAWLVLLLPPLGLLVIVLGSGGWRTVLDRAAGRFSIQRRGLLRARPVNGDLGAVTGTLIISRRSSKSRHERLGLLAADGEFHPLGRWRHSGYKRMRAEGRKICEFLGLEPSCAIEPEQVAISNSEAIALLGNLAKHREEADQLRGQLQASPDDVDQFRRLAICLMRLERRQEAGEILRNAYRHFLQHGNRRSANQIAAVTHTLGV
jgi:hypothetical protein